MIYPCNVPRAWVGGYHQHNVHSHANISIYGLNYWKFRIRFMHMMHIVIAVCQHACHANRLVGWMGRSDFLNAIQTIREHIEMSFCTYNRDLIQLLQQISIFSDFQAFLECVKFHIVLPILHFRINTDTRTDIIIVIVCWFIIIHRTICYTLKSTCNSFLIYFCLFLHKQNILDCLHCVLPVEKKTETSVKFMPANKLKLLLLKCEIVVAAAMSVFFLLHFCLFVGQSKCNFWLPNAHAVTLHGYKYE